MLVSLGILLIFGLWVSQNRHVDFWVLMGIGAIVARMWTYHMMYDDLIIVLPMIALFRVDLFFLIDCSRRQNESRLNPTALIRDRQHGVIGSLSELTR